MKKHSSLIVGRCVICLLLSVFLVPLPTVAQPRSALTEEIETQLARAQDPDQRTFLRALLTVLQKGERASASRLRAIQESQAALSPADMLAAVRAAGVRRQLQQALADTIAACRAVERMDDSFRRDVESEVSLQRFQRPGAGERFTARFFDTVHREVALDRERNRLTRELYEKLASLFDRAAASSAPQQLIAAEWLAIRRRMDAVSDLSGR